MIIRAATEKDMDEFFELYWASNIEHENYEELDKLKQKEVCKDRKMEEFHEQLFNKDHSILVAELNNKLIGIISGCIESRDDPTIFTIDKVGVVEELYVKPEFRKNGIGQKLLDEMCLELQLRGARFVGLAVAAKNKALRMYLKNGFKIKSYWLVKK